MEQQPIMNMPEVSESNLLDNPYLRTALALMLVYLPRMMSDVPSVLKNLFSNMYVKLAFLGFVIYSSVEGLSGDEKMKVVCMLVLMVVGTMMYFSDTSLEATSKRRQNMKGTYDPDNKYTNNGMGEQLHYRTDFRTRVNPMRGTLPYFDSYNEPESRDTAPWNSPNQPMLENETNLASQGEYEVLGTPLNEPVLEKMGNSPSYDVNKEEEISEVDHSNDVVPYENTSSALNYGTSPTLGCQGACPRNLDSQTIL